MKPEKIVKALRQLTGRTRFRADKRGRLVLQVQFKEAYSPEDWRDARTQDLAELQTLYYSTINIMLPEAPMDFGAPVPVEVKNGPGKPN
jgi:hypothetical protein